MNDGIDFIDLGTDDPNVIAMKVNGKVTAEAIIRLVERLEALNSPGRTARLYLDLSGYAGYELPVVREKLAHMSTLWNSIERCAYVVDKAWMATAIGLFDALTPMHLRAFVTDQVAEARAWILDGI